MRLRTFAGALVAAFAAILLGITGAGAFNPNAGYVAHFDPLWRVFGIGVYLGVIALPVILLTGFVALVLRFTGRLKTGP